MAVARARRAASRRSGSACSSATGGDSDRGQQPARRETDRRDRARQCLRRHDELASPFYQREPRDSVHSTRVMTPRCVSGLRGAPNAVACHAWYDSPCPLFRSRVCHFTLTETSVLAIIPARYQSTRLPGKALARHRRPSDDRARVSARARPRARSTRVVVATDDERIAAAVERVRRRRAA